MFLNVTFHGIVQYLACNYGSPVTLGQHGFLPAHSETVMYSAAKQLFQCHGVIFPGGRVFVTTKSISVVAELWNILRLTIINESTME
jgi:hypothetical protein